MFIYRSDCSIGVMDADSTPRPVARKLRFGKAEASDADGDDTSSLIVIESDSEREEEESSLFGEPKTEEAEDPFKVYVHSFYAQVFTTVNYIMGFTEPSLSIMS
jgi:hypothetical protein